MGLLVDRSAFTSRRYAGYKALIICRYKGVLCDNRPIGVFDSGFGGLTVARELVKRLPEENIIYYGDTAHCPYGPRDPEEVRSFDAGIMASGDWFFTKKIAATAQLSWGLVPIFPSDFEGLSYKMYNIYLSLGIAYRL